MKKLLILVAGIILLVLILLGIVFFKPLLVINPTNLKHALNYSKVLDHWSWESATFKHEWMSWNQRRFAGAFEGFCIKKKTASFQLDLCLDRFTWNFDLRFDFKKGFHSVSLEPIVLRSSKANVTLLESPSKEPSSPPHLRRYWNIFWSDVVPDMDFIFHKISFSKDERPFVFDLTLRKIPKRLDIVAMSFSFTADPKGFVLKGPNPYPIKKDLGTSRPIVFHDVTLEGKVNETDLPLFLHGSLENIKFWAKTNFSLPLKGGFDSLAFRKEVMGNLTAEVSLKGLKRSLKEYAPAPYDELPAPFNSLDGDIILSALTRPGKEKDVEIISANTKIQLAGADQVVRMEVLAKLPMRVMNFKRGALTLEFLFHEVRLELPRLSKKSLPPQFIPDKRFQSGRRKNLKESKSGFNLHLVATEEQALVIKTNLLDEDLRLNFDIRIVNNELQNGFLKILPFKTKVFKRAIKLKHALISFRAKRSPVINARVQFPLPEYKIGLDIEGPTAKPRYVFSSDPPLPQSDIYSVLLLGRPMDDLSSEDKTAVQKTNQVLAQGILSLSTLYFLSGGPVESIAYDPDSKNITAQFGLTDKTSLRVGGGGGEGINSTSIRRALGKGWYIDSSVQDSTTSVQQKEKDYGVLLERIISY